MSKLLNFCKKNLIIQYVLTDYEKKNGVKIYTSPDTYIVKYVDINNNITLLCSIQNCLNKLENFNLCIKHINEKIIFEKNNN